MDGLTVVSSLPSSICFITSRSVSSNLISISSTFFDGLPYFFLSFSIDCVTSSISSSSYISSFSVCVGNGVARPNSLFDPSWILCFSVISGSILVSWRLSKIYKSCSLFVEVGWLWSAEGWWRPRGFVFGTTSICWERVTLSISFWTCYDAILDSRSFALFSDRILFASFSSSLIASLGFLIGSSSRFGLSFKIGSGS